MMTDKQLNVWIRSDLRDAIREVAEQQGRTMTAVVEDFLEQGIARLRGEVIEQQSLPVVREAIQREVGQATPTFLRRYGSGSARSSWMASKSSREERG